MQEKSDRNLRTEEVRRILRDCKELRGMTDADVAARIGFEPTYVQKIRKGTKEPGEDFVRAVEDMAAGRVAGRVVSEEIPAEVILMARGLAAIARRSVGEFLDHLIREHGNRAAEDLKAISRSSSL